MLLSSNLHKNAMSSLNFSSKPISSLFNLSDFPQRTVESRLPICFTIKIKVGKSVCLYMHTDMHVCIYTFVY